MKFSLALGLLFAGLAHSQLLQTNHASVDDFLRQNQHLKSSAQLISVKQNGPISTVTYQDGPVNMKYNVRAEDNEMKVVGIQQMVTYSGNLKFNPNSVNKHNIQIQQLPPLPLFMPQFKIQGNGDVSMTNVFDKVEKDIAEMHQKMNINKRHFQISMNKQREQLKARMNKKIEKDMEQMPLIGGGDHDRNWATDVSFDSPLIGGDHDYNWATEIEIQPNEPLIGGPHDYNWDVNIQNDLNHPLFGSGDHDNWKNPSQNIQLEPPIIGGDNHDNWQNMKKHCKKNLKNENLIGEGDHDNWKNGKHKWNKHHKSDRKQKRHHSNMAWMNKQFSSEQILPYLKQKLPDMVNNNQIVNVLQKGFEKGKGFKLSIQIKNQQNKIQEIQAFIKPRKHQFNINKISTITEVKNDLQMGQNLVAEVMKNIQESLIKPIIQIETDVKTDKVMTQETENLVAPTFIPQTFKQLLLGGEQDPDHDGQFMKMPQEIEGRQNNHIPIKEEQYQMPLLGGQTDPDHSITEKKEQFDVTGLPLPGGQTDPDHKENAESIIKQVIDIATNVFEDENVDDIEEVEEHDEKKTDKLQLATQR